MDKEVQYPSGGSMPSKKVKPTDGVPCPECGITTKHVVMDTRRDSQCIKRIRECACGSRFCTHERVYLHSVQQGRPGVVT